MVNVVCAGCGAAFEAERRSAKWCSDRCRKAAGRQSPDPAAEQPPSTVEPVEEPERGLVASVRQELEAAGAVDTFSGQLALQLARRLADPDESGISSLSKELRTVMAAALEGSTLPPAEGQASSVEEEDEVTKARRLREQARQAAGLA